MNEEDPLRSVLREWEAPEPSASLDKRVREQFAQRHPSLWRRMWTFRVSLPAPVLALLLLIAVGMVLYERRAASAPVKPGGIPGRTVPAEYLTKIEATGFRALPDGAVRVVRAEKKKGESQQ